MYLCRITAVMLVWKFLESILVIFFTNSQFNYIFVVFCPFVNKQMINFTFFLLLFTYQLPHTFRSS